MQAGRGHHRAEWREDVVDQVGDHRPPLVRHRGSTRAGRGSGRGRGRTGRRPAGGARRPGRGRRPVPARRPRRRRSRRSGRPVAGRSIPGPFLEPSEGCPRGSHPERDAIAGRIRPRGEPQLAQAVAQAMPVGAPGRPQADAIDDRIVGIEMGQRRAGDDRQVEVRRPAGDPGEAAARVPASKPTSTTSTRRSRISASATAPAPSARRASFGGRASSTSRSASGPPGVPRLAAGPSRTSPARVAMSPNALRCSLIPPASTTVRSRRRPAAAATSAASSPSARRSSAAGGSLAPTRTHDTPASRRRVVIASGSIVSALPPTVRQPLREAVASSGARARSDAATTAIVRGGWLATSSRGRRFGGAGAQVEGGGKRPVGGHGTVAEDRDDGLDVGSGRHRQRPDEAPAPADPPDQGGSCRGGARIEGEEGSGFARHPLMLPGPAAGRCRAVRDALRRPRRSRRPSPRDGR